MPYVITKLCINDGACVEVCPVGCIHTQPGAPQFYIDPDVCIDCEQCEIVCPVDAIFRDCDVPPEHQDAIEINAAFFRKNKAPVAPVPFATALEMVRAAEAYARRSALAVSVAIVDEAGAPIVVSRMDGAEPLSAELAFYKAYTAAAFHLPTAEVAPLARRPWFRSLVVAHRGRILSAAGGLVMAEGSAIIGGIGVAGSPNPEQDVLCCQAALALFAAAGH
ncbi:MAG TPA: heme-binding protein [Candidatus Acidoferrales bacterium]|nr:heme-binding protein [Candidatus Acidoferrales bacterium]